ncbi:MAG TPA: hypothetical protein VFG86_19245 [Chloroflexota bacterium]|jgi:hypothetical protein|nr:hypothetical protein [Chloroflexota bacterium]
MLARSVWLAALFVLFTTGCRGGARGAAPLPMPTDFAQWLAIALFVVGIWWLAMKILKG